MNKEEQSYDFLAAAEETSKQYDMMVRQIPGHIKNALAEEYRHSPWLTEIPKTMEKLHNVLTDWQNSNLESQKAAQQLRQTNWLVLIVICLLAVLGVFNALT